MLRARDRILAMGGVVCANVFTKITLALFEQYDWKGIPSMPPEIMLLPKRFYFSIYAISYWSRAVLIPLLVVFANQPVCRISREQGIDELYVAPRSQIHYRDVPPFNKDQRWFTPHNFFVQLDRVLKLYDRMPLSWLREKALQKAATWMLEHIKGSGGLGAIYPAMANSIVALRCLGYQVDDPLVRKALHEIESLEVYDMVSIGEQRVESTASSALPLSNLGYGIAHERPHRNRDAAGPSISPEGGRVLGLSSNENGWRLEVLVSRCGTGRLVLPVRKRILSRCG